MDAVFHLNFGWGGRDVDWCLDLCYLLFGRDFCFTFFWLGGGGGFGILRGQILLNFF